MVLAAAARRASLLAVLALLGAAAYCQLDGVADRLFPGLPSGDRARLARGELIVRAPSKPGDLLLAASPQAASLVAEIGRLGPNYIVETISLARAEGSEAALGRLEAALAAVEAYPRIRFYSKRWGREYPIFESIGLLSRTGGQSSEEPGLGGQSWTTVEALATMDPLIPPFKASYSWSRAEGRLEFASRNLGAIVYKSVRAIQPGGMVWRMIAFREGQVLVAYSVGAARVFDLLGSLRDRLESAFSGRAQAFFAYMHGRLED